MIKCPSCGFHNPESRPRCLKCSTALHAQAVPDGSHLADAPEQRFHLRIAFRHFLYRLGTRIQGTIPTGLPHRFPWTAALLSLLFGAGQVYNHQYGKAVLFGISQLGLIALFVYTIFEPWNDYILLALLFWILFVMADGFSTAVKINGDYWRWRQILAVWFALLFSISGTFFILTLFGHGLIRMNTVRSDALAPAFHRGDKVLVLAWPFRDLLLDRGSVVLYDPPRFAYVRPGALSDDTFSVNERNSVGVVTAAEGDILSWSGEGPIRVNGSPVPPNMLPLVPNGAPYSGDVTIPADHFGILFTHRVVEEGIIGRIVGGSFAGNLPNPREASLSGYRIEGYENVVKIERGKVLGVIVCCFYPPQHRRWFGGTRGLWREYPADYPAGQ